MAYKILTPEEIKQQLSTLDKQQAALDAKKGSSFSFYSGLTPTNKDVLTDIQLRDLKAREEKLKSNLLSQKYYGKQVPGEETTSQESRQGLIGKGLDILSRPLYGVVGAASYLTGKGKKTLGASVEESVKARDTWGDLLKRMNVMPSVASTLGFGLDVITDPVNLLSGGLVGLERTALGKVAKGAVTKGAEGAVKTAVKAGALKTASGLSKLAYRVADAVPGIKVNRKAIKVADDMMKAGVEAGTPEYTAAIRAALYPSEKGVGKVVGAVREGVRKLGEKSLKLGEKAMAESKKYDELVGFNMNDVLEARADRESIAGKIKSFLVQLPGGENLISKFEYNPNRWTQQAKLWDLMQKAYKEQGREITQVWNPLAKRMESPTMMEIDKFLEDVSTKANIPETAVTKFSTRKEAINALEKDIAEGYDLFKAEKGAVAVDNALEAKEALLAELRNNKNIGAAFDVMRQHMSAEELGAADKVRDFISKKIKIKNVEAGQKFLNVYDKFMGFFIKAKISSLSPASMVYAVLGNATMQHMSGINMLRPEVYKRLGDAAALLTAGRIGGVKKMEKALTELLTDPQMSRFLETHGGSGGAFTKSIGLDLKKLGTSTVFEQIINKATKSGAFKDLGSEAFQREVVADLNDAMRDPAIRNLMRQSTPLEFYMREGADAIKKSEIPTGILPNELAPYKAFLKLQEKIAARAKEGSRGAKVLNWALNRSRDFELTDQTWKLENFLLLTQDGLTERELLKMTNNFITTGARIRPEDITNAVYRNGEKYYKLSPEKALEVANETFMNYAAMPAFVKAVRSMPIVGSPFFAFTYAMLAKTGKTLLTNPAAFNQVNFLMKELEKEKSPLEREALKSQYYAWMDKPGMINLGENVPFFKGHPIYLNLAQMIPYYSMNILNPSERKFNADVRGQVASVIDRSPVLKTPVGQILMDYVILPSIIADEQPQNMFGGPLYAEGTKAPEKVARAGKSLAEAVFPSSIAPIGMAPIPDDILRWLPSYPAQKLGFAVRGKNTLGITGEEDPASRGLRAWLSLAGVNLYPVDLKNLSNEIKKRQQ